MNKSLNIITGISYASSRAIQSFNPSTSGNVRIATAVWKPVDYVIGSAGFTINEDKDKNGETYISNLSVNLRSSMADPGPVLVKIEFDSGEVIIIGEPDLPVRFEKNNSLTQKNLKIQHKSWHYPYKLQR